MTQLVHVWSVPASGVSPGATADLSRSELARAETLRRPQDRRRRLIGAALLHRAVARLADCPVRSVRIDRRCADCGTGDHGRPVIAAPATGLHASVAHAGDQIVVACAQGRQVGVDIESDVALPFRDVAPIALAPAERTAVNGPQQLARIWARKEAVLKLVGIGLAYPPGALVVTAPEASPRILAWSEAPPELPPAITLRDLEAATGYAAAVAVAGDDAEVRQLDGLALLEPHRS